MTAEDALAWAVMHGYWIVRGDWSIGKRLDGQVVVVAYPFHTKGRVETPWKTADVMDAVSAFVAGSDGSRTG